MRFGLILGGAIAAFSLVACTPGSDVPRDPYADMEVDTHDGEFATIQQFTTPKGVSVWLVEEPSIPILSLRMAWETGSTSDPEGLEGLTDAMVYQMNEGAGELDSQAFFKRMEELNMSFGCGSGNDSTYCNASMLTENAAGSFEMIGLALSEPRFDEGPWERFVRETEVNLKTRETNPNYLATRAVRAALYSDHPYARELSVDSLAALTADAARAHKDQIMVQDGLLVTAVGAMSAPELAQLIDGAVIGLPETGASIETPLAVLADPQAPITVTLPQPQTLVRFIGPAMTRDDPDFFPAVVLNYVFGAGGFESRLMEDLREKKGLTYGVGTSLSSGEHLQMWSGSGQTRNECAAKFVEGVKENMQLLVGEGMSADELSDAKAYLTGSYPLGFDSNAKIAGNMMSVRIDGLAVDYFDQRNSLVNEVTLDQVNSVAERYLKPENFTFVMVGQPDGFDDGEEGICEIG